MQRHADRECELHQEQRRHPEARELRRETGDREEEQEHQAGNGHVHACDHDVVEREHLARAVDLVQQGVVGDQT